MSISSQRRARGSKDRHVLNIIMYGNWEVNLLYSRPLQKIFQIKIVHNKISYKKLS